MKGQHQGMSRPVDVVIAAQRGRQKPMDSDHSRASVGGPQRRLGVTGLSWLHQCGDIRLKVLGDGSFDVFIA